MNILRVDGLSTDTPVLGASQIIIVYGVLMFHVALIYTCNMKENALISCISYARSHRVELGVGAWYCYLPFLVNEW